MKIGTNIIANAYRGASPLTKVYRGATEVWAAGGGFSPADVAGLLMWLNAEDIGGADNDLITTWADASGNGNDAVNTLGGTSRPVYKTNIVNGLPVLRFEGSEDEMTLPDFSALTEGELFIVLKNTTDPPTTGGGGAFRLGTDGSGSLVPFSDGNIYCSFGTTSRKTTVNPTPAMDVFCIYSVYSASGDWANYLDGVQLYSTATNTVGFSATATLGKSATYFAGDIAEVILYDNKVSAPDRADVITYLTTRYGI